MTTDSANSEREMREAFEHWMSDGGESPRAVGRNQSGEYLLMQASYAWQAWQAAYASLRSSLSRKDEEIEGLRKEVADLKATLYDETVGITGNLLRENIIADKDGKLWCLVPKNGTSWDMRNEATEILISNGMEQSSPLVDAIYRAMVDARPIFVAAQAEGRQEGK